MFYAGPGSDTGVGRRRREIATGITAVERRRRKSLLTSTELSGMPRPYADEVATAPNPDARPGRCERGCAWRASALRGRDTSVDGPGAGGPCCSRPATGDHSCRAFGVFRTPLGPAWLEVAQSRFAHDGATPAALIDAPAPRLLGHDGARVLLVDIEDAKQPYHRADVGGWLHLTADQLIETAG